MFQMCMGSLHFQVPPFWCLTFVPFWLFWMRMYVLLKPSYHPIVLNFFFKKHLTLTSCSLNEVYSSIVFISNGRLANLAISLNRASIILMSSNREHLSWQNPWQSLSNRSSARSALKFISWNSWRAYWNYRWNVVCKMSFPDPPTSPTTLLCGQPLNWSCEGDFLECYRVL
jgi:hypothetical protein